MGLLTHFSQEEPFDLSQKSPGMPGLRLSLSDGESVPGSSCQDEDEESLYRRSQYSPEVDQQEPAGEEPYIPELEDREKGCPSELRPEKTQKPEKYPQSSDHEAAEGQSIDLRGEQEDLLESETSCESDEELDEQAHHHEKLLRQSYDYDSEEQQLDEPEQTTQQFDGFYEVADVEETKTG